MEAYEAIMKRRTVRKFGQEKIAHEDIIKIIDCGRMSASGANLQPVKYAVAETEELCSEIYPYTKWAGYISGWEPAQNERPVAYIAVLTDTSIKSAEKSEVDCGSAIANMMIGALSLGIGSCWLGAIDRKNIAKVLNLDEKYHVSYLLALGYPMQSGVTYDMEENDAHYYFDENGNVHVPKRTLNDVIV